MITCGDDNFIAKTRPVLEGIGYTAEMRKEISLQLDLSLTA